ncbi:MAG: hypothetical protein BWY85_01570 [Firmicutes bacterium ADurb.Bin506]|nr:MAG: hypothetical protein BWY85_01570 [Firmicutes bacterium ADurb.Bin506]
MGVFSSCETLEMNSLRISSILRSRFTSSCSCLLASVRSRIAPSSRFDMVLMLFPRAPISSSWCPEYSDEKSSCATRSAMSFISSTGLVNLAAYQYARTAPTRAISVPLMRKNLLATDALSCIGASEALSEAYPPSGSTPMSVMKSSFSLSSLVELYTM